MKKLEQIRQESKEIKDKINDTEERLRQLKNQENKILKQDIVKRRKERTHRLITRGAILESLIENAEELTDEEIKILLRRPTMTKELKKTLWRRRPSREKTPFYYKPSTKKNYGNRLRRYDYICNLWVRWRRKT